MTSFKSMLFYIRQGFCCAAMLPVLCQCHSLWKLQIVFVLPCG
uniref:Uncharacterized protein n=1 Tax=Anguilla anguilla TaxID=7936 RepID=A0A0E9QI62_ANGAN